MTPLSQEEKSIKTTPFGAFVRTRCELGCHCTCHQAVVLCLLEVFPTPTCHLSRIDPFPSRIFLFPIALFAPLTKKRIRTDSRQQLLPLFAPHVFCVNHVNGGCLLTSSHGSPPPSPLPRDGRHACLVEARCTNTATLVSTVSIPKRNRSATKKAGGGRDGEVESLTRCSADSQHPM